ncbi:MAG: DeoR/GlpR transcriptional regulator [Oscillospiraceae bacterium]|nr:DeoR/GlpR transcriptional regulator [Oscillospiraceae bacterium]
MLAAERRRVITERIRAAGQVAVSALSAEFQVSEETIRRDLEWLEKEGIATRRYGGAVLTGNDRVAPPYAIRKNTNTELKLILARQLARLVRDGDTLMVDESSTAAYAIRAIRHLHNITLVTNSLELPIEMIGQESWHIISTGGSLKPEVLAHVGPHALRTVSSYHARYAIFSCRGINSQLGLADSDDAVVQIKRAMIRSSDCAILLADHRKFDRTGFVELGTLDLVDKLITDSPPAPQWQERLTKCGVELICDQQQCK